METSKIWNDIINYSLNLNGNWLFSRHIFYFNIIPTVEKDPAGFAEWVREMVKKSGIRLKSRSGFAKAINLLKKLNAREDKRGIGIALYYLFESGLEEAACTGAFKSVQFQQ